MYTLYKFHFLNGISEMNQLFDDILIIWPTPVYKTFFAFVMHLAYCIFCPVQYVDFQQVSLP